MKAHEPKEFHVMNVKKPTEVLEVRGYAFGREVFPAEQFRTVSKALDFMLAHFPTHRGLTCYFESGTLHPDGTFVAHEGGICLKLTDSLKVVAA